MQSRKKTFQTPGAELETLDKEHSNIHRQYLELDDAILQGKGSPRILEAARMLIRFMLSHLVHEEKFGRSISCPVREEQRSAWKKHVAELLQIEVALKQDEVFAALRLRGFCKGWMHEHMHVEKVEFEIGALAGVKETPRIQASSSVGS